MNKEREEHALRKAYKQDIFGNYIFECEGCGSVAKKMRPSIKGIVLCNKCQEIAKFLYGDTGKKYKTIRSFLDEIESMTDQSGTPVIDEYVKEIIEEAFVNIKKKESIERSNRTNMVHKCKNVEDVLKYCERMGM